MQSLRLLQQSIKGSVFQQFRTMTASPFARYSTISDEISLTEECKKMIEKKSKNNKFLRLTVDSGEGCGGFVYKFSFDEAIGEDDFVYKTPAEKILFACDSLTLNFVKGATLDHESEMMRSSFFVSVNPNAEKECSCKVSFSPKDSVFQ